MQALLIILSVLNLVAGQFSVTGRRLLLPSHPFVVALRWFALGGVSTLMLTGHDFTGHGWLGWALVLMLAVGAARVPARSGVSTTPSA